MKLSMITETVQDQLEEISKAYDIEQQKLQNKLKTATKKYWKWVLNQLYKDLQQSTKLWDWYDQLFDLDSYINEITPILQTFDKVKKKLPHNDINKYKDIEQLMAAVQPYERFADALLGKDVSKILDLAEEYESAILVDKYGPVSIYAITDDETLADVGVGTKWCTRADHPRCRAYDYIADYGVVYVIFINNKPFIQYTPSYEEIMYADNEPVKNPEHLKLIPQPPLDENSTPVSFKSTFGYAVNVLGKPWPELEERVSKLGELGLQPIEIDEVLAYAMKYMKEFYRGKRWIELENAILDNLPRLPKFERAHGLDIGVKYAIIVGERIEKLEQFILKFVEEDVNGTAYVVPNYVKRVMGRRWLELEKLLYSSRNIIRYVRIFDERLPEYEEYLIDLYKSTQGKSLNYGEQYKLQQRAVDASLYCATLDVRVKALEPLILQDPAAIYNYARDVLKQRWPEGEQELKKHDQEYIDAYYRLSFI